MRIQRKLERTVRKSETSHFSALVFCSCHTPVVISFSGRKKTVEYTVFFLISCKAYVQMGRSILSFTVMFCTKENLIKEISRGIFAKLLLENICRNAAVGNQTVRIVFAKLSFCRHFLFGQRGKFFCGIQNCFKAVAEHLVKRRIILCLAELIKSNGFERIIPCRRRRRIL